MKNAIYSSAIAACLSVIVTTTSFSQTNDVHIVNSTGGSFSNSTAKLDFSVGEVAITPITSSSNIITIGFLQPVYSNTLAISLLSLTAEVTPTGQVDLTWVTTEEINNNHFDVERSADGITFSRLLTVAGNGNSSIAHTYKAVDPTPFPNITYYQLKQVDNNGGFTMSKVIAVTISNTNSNFIVYPNPVASSVNIRPAGSQPFQLKISDATGRLISESSYAGQQTAVDLSALAKGMYLLQLYSKDGKFIQSVKITKQ